MHPLNSRAHWLRPAAALFVALILILLLWPRQPPLRIAPPGALSGEGFVGPLEGEFQPEAPLPVPAAPARQPVAATPNIRIHVNPGSYPQDLAVGLATSMEESLTYVSERTGAQLGGPVDVTFARPEGGCGLHAAAYTGERAITLYACPDIPSRRAVNVLAHEWVHQLAHDYYGPTHLQADLILSEGLATWGAGRYWLGRYGSFHDFVAREYGGGLLPLAADPRAGVSTATLNQIYYQWASYIEWLLDTAGKPAVDQLYRTGKGRAIASADYQGTLGIDFAESETRWREWLGQSR